MENLLLYHFPCVDGAYAVLAMHRFLPNCVFVPHRTNVALNPDELRAAHPHPDTHVWLLDYCGPNSEFILRLCASFKQVTLLDHHKTALDLVSTFQVPDNLRIVLDMERSGATIALGEDPGQGNTYSANLLKIYAYIEDNDLWRHRLPMSKQFTAGLASMRIDLDLAACPQSVAMLDNLDFDTVLELGAAELERTTKLIAHYLSVAYPVRIGNDATTFTMAVQIADDDYGVTSQLGHELALKSDSRMGAVVRLDRTDATKYNVSLRGVDGVDTTLVACRFGGGGHKGASGFSVTREQWQTFM